MTRKEVEERLEKAGVYSDKLSSKNGLFTFKRAYFYHHGQTAQQWAERIARAIPEAEIVKVDDEFRPWPKTSYFVVQFRIAKPE